MQIAERVPLAPLTTLEIGGPARWFAEAHTEQDVRDAVAFAKQRSLPVFVLGGGSNLVVSDAGYGGLVLRVGLGGHEEATLGDTRLVVAGAGEEWDALVRHCVAEGLQGLECLSGIPGTVGGTPVQNVGAYGQEVGACIRGVRALDLAADRVVEMPAEACGFAYRSSVFNGEARGRYVVLAVTFELAPGGAPCTGYRDVQARFEGRAPSLAAVREAVLDIRRSKSMTLGAEDPNRRSAGSFFKNPVVTEAACAALGAAAGADAPRFPAPAGSVKVPAAWLIERAGFARGDHRGAVGISTKHTLALVNLGGAKAAELMAFADEIRSRVRERFGVELVPEPVFVGFDAR